MMQNASGRVRHEAVWRPLPAVATAWAVACQRLCNPKSNVYIQLLRKNHHPFRHPGFGLADQMFYAARNFE